MHFLSFVISRKRLSEIFQLFHWLKCVSTQRRYFSYNQIYVRLTCNTFLIFPILPLKKKSTRSFSGLSGRARKSTLNVLTLPDVRIFSVCMRDLANFTICARTVLRTTLFNMQRQLHVNL